MRARKNDRDPRVGWRVWRSMKICGLPLPRRGRRIFTVLPDPLFNKYLSPTLARQIMPEEYASLSPAREDTLHPSIIYSISDNLFISIDSIFLFFYPGFDFSGISFEKYHQVGTPSCPSG